MSVTKATYRSKCNLNEENYKPLGEYFLETTNLLFAKLLISPSESYRL